MTERLTALKTSLLKKCPTYHTDDYLRQVRELAAQGDPEAREYLALRTTAQLLHIALAPTYRYELLTDAQRALIAKPDFELAIEMVRQFPMPAHEPALCQPK